MSKLDETLQKLKGVQNRKIEKSAESIQPVTVKIDRRRFNHAGPGSGRPPKEANIIARAKNAALEAHYDENIKIRATDPKTGKVREIAKPRKLLVMEQLFLLGMGQTTQGNVDALNKWLDRALGKPEQPIVGDETKPILLKIDI